MARSSSCSTGFIWPRAHLAPRQPRPVA